MRTNAEIESEIGKLEKLKSKVPEENVFGSSHIDAIDAQILVLEKRMREDQFPPEWCDEEAEEYDEDLYQHALSASFWLYKENKQEAPSKGWKELIK